MKPCIPLSPFEIDSTHHIHHSTITNDSVILTCQPLVFDDRFLCLTGSYVYIETSAPRKLGDKAWLLGPEITAYQTICLFLLVQHERRERGNAECIHVQQRHFAWYSAVETDREQGD
ncbi:hypothetical protein DPMN_188038 [Dreissena polymorpha]|uniref:Uncharacterized protein n=1 Tax=Dreissena polymorpha TaxID=45954 RepID=A0A9D4IAZ5_DREPO|nr:hypothetical protein DPMN_188038 [Dreissena polymorpha]